MNISLHNSRDKQLLDRAQRVVPGGVWGHMATHAIAPGYPQFFSKSDGCRVWDADGNEYVDFMCAWGPNLLGYRHPEVDAAAFEQMKTADISNGPTETMVELAELMVDTLDGADWTLFQKNGTDATTACVMIARAHTGKRKILVARGAYHGAVPWCTPSVVGVTDEDKAHLILFDFNDIASLEKAAADAEGDLAGVILSAFRHDVMRDQELATPEFMQAARDICDRADAALILDDVRASFRIDLRGSWASYGIQPDLTAMSKSIANGWPLAAVAGGESFRQAASKVFVTGSFWYGAAAMAASIATIGVVKRDHVIDHIAAMGERLRAGLDEAAARHGFSLRQTGPAQIPAVLFDGDHQLRLGNAFGLAALRHGAYFHPRHNMFICAAHSASDIDRGIEAADHAMADMIAAGVVPD
ncbi:aminotransferase class III-fold pyridoxal phosphate-dependent enzyme [Martelella soudanensis]|uniref:aminotransferase class III-fold pyridoxal phosphate-dependent enzyme n=1 Tax=unclassified Martelella TaxID=2629616 RepID=UPI0015DF48D2|nr:MULTISPECIES: aminotransferase class III-fold pyridoxal phosphate-dependent enzyme [unclassified Martelella]